MKKLAALAAVVSLVLAGVASAAPKAHNRATDTVALNIQVFWGDYPGAGPAVGYGVAVYCQTPNGTGKVYTSSNGTAGCIVPAGVWVAVYAWWPESGCIRYYFGANNYDGAHYGLAQWVNTQGGALVNLYNNYAVNLCG